MQVYNIFIYIDTNTERITLHYKVQYIYNIIYTRSHIVALHAVDRMQG